MCGVGLFYYTEIDLFGLMNSNCVPGVGLNDKPEFVCNNLAVNGEPEPLEAEYVTEHYSDVVILGGVFYPR